MDSQQNESSLFFLSIIRKYLQNPLAAATQISAVNHWENQMRHRALLQPQRDPRAERSQAHGASCCGRRSVRCVPSTLPSPSTVIQILFEISIYFLIPAVGQAPLNPKYATHSGCSLGLRITLTLMNPLLSLGS